MFICNTTCCLIHVEPEPPGFIDKNASTFHPQKLHLQLIKSDNNTYVNRYEIWIDEYRLWQWKTPFFLSLNLEPGRNYTLRIKAYAWYYPLSKGSVPMVDQIQTMRK